MRRLAGGIAGAFALLAMLIMQPWDLTTCDPAFCEHYSDHGSLWLYPLMLAFYLVLPLLVVGVIQVAVLGIRNANSPHDLAVRAALGESQGRALRSAAIRGLYDGALWVGLAYVVAACVHVGIVVSSGWPLDSEAAMWFIRAIEGVFVIGTLVLAHVIDAARPRRTPVERLFEDARPFRTRRWARILGLALGVVGGLASGAVVGLALTYELAPNFRVTNAAGIAQAVAVISAVVLGLAVAIPALRAALPGTLRVTSMRLRGPAGSIVSARAGAVSRAGARTVLVLGSFGFLFGAVASTNPSPSLSPTYVGYRLFYDDIDADASADRLRAVDGVADVIVPAVREGLDTNGNPGALFAVDPQALSGLDDTLAGILTEHPSAIVTNLWRGTADLHLAPTTAWSFTPSGVVPIEPCCAMFTSTESGMESAPGLTAFLIYSTDPALNGDIQYAAWSIYPSDFAPGGGEGSGMTGSSETYWPGVLIQMGLLALLIGTPMVALAVGVVRARRSEDATLAALGSTPGAIRTALVVETAATSALAVTVGLGLGALTHAGSTALERARSSLTGVITDSYVATAFGSVAWVALAVVLVATVALMAFTAWIASRSASHATPVEALRPESVGGVR